MALFLNKEGKESDTWLLKCKEERLHEYKKDEFPEKAQIIVSSGACEACIKDDGKILSIAEALDEKLLPHKNCSCKMFDETLPFCQCTYVGAYD